MSDARSSTPSRAVTDAYLATGMLLNYADRSALPVVFPALRTEMGLTDVEFGLLGTVFLWTYAICGPLAGMLADRYSRALIVVVSLGAWSFVTLLTGFANSFAMVFALRLLLGVTESLYLPAAAAVLASNHDAATRGRAIGMLQVATALGVVVGGVGVGYAAERFGWRTGFIALGIVGIALALVGRQMVHERSAAATSETGVVNRSPLEAISYLIRVPTYLTLLVGTICAGIAVWIFFNWLSLYLVEHYGINMSQAGFAGMGTLQIASMVGIMCGAWVSDRLVRRDFRNRMLVFACGYLVASPFLFVFLGSHSVVVVAICCAVFSFFRAFGAVNELPILCEVVPKPFRSTAVGILLACATTAGGLGIFVGGVLKRTMGLNLVFGWLGVFFAFAGLAYFFAYARWLQRDISRATDWTARQAGLSP
jgi:MFS transporter, Spinster family, sphingosine-1-phosphate transporter